MNMMRMREAMMMMRREVRMSRKGVRRGRTMMMKMTMTSMHVWMRNNKMTGRKEVRRPAKGMNMRLGEMGGRMEGDSAAGHAGWSPIAGTGHCSEKICDENNLGSGVGVTARAGVKRRLEQSCHFGL